MPFSTPVSRAATTAGACSTSVSCAAMAAAISTRNWVWPTSVTRWMRWRERSPQAVKSWLDWAKVGRVVVGNAGSPDSVEPPLQDGGKAKPPSREHQNEGFSRKQPLYLCLSGRGIKWRIVIALAFADSKRGREFGFVEIFHLYFVSSFSQHLDSESSQGMAQAVGNWMGDYDKTLHVKNGLRDTVLMLANAVLCGWFVAKKRSINSTLLGLIRYS